jgi:hypothetical protein
MPETLKHNARYHDPSPWDIENIGFMHRSHVQYVGNFSHMEINVRKERRHIFTGCSKMVDNKGILTQITVGKLI